MKFTANSIRIYERGGIMGNNTIKKAIRILELISKNRQGLTLAEISKMLSMPKSSVFDIVSTLHDEGLVYIKNEYIKNYAIGAKLYVYGSIYMKSSNLLKVSRPYVNALADKYERTGFISKCDKEQFTYVYKYESPNTRIVTANVGDHGSMHSTAVGKVFMACDAGCQVNVDSLKMQPYTPNTLTTREELLSELESVNINGYALDDGENEAHMTCVAAPIYDYLGEVIGVISLSGLKQTEDLALIGEDVKEKAALISKRVYELEHL